MMVHLRRYPTVLDSVASVPETQRAAANYKKSHRAPVYMDRPMNMETQRVAANYEESHAVPHMESQHAAPMDADRSTETQRAAAIDKESHAAPNVGIQQRQSTPSTLTHLTSHPRHELLLGKCFPCYLGQGSGHPLASHFQRRPTSHLRLR